jgi:hypothetical protein
LGFNPLKKKKGRCFMGEYAGRLLSAKEIAQVLHIADCAEMTGEQIASAMLDGHPAFTLRELHALAGYLGLPLEEMLARDIRLAHYAPCVRFVEEE